ncbi:MAG: type IX secretion system protein PorQ [Sphingobacteriia bacterium]|jgi:hypothetical protein|nr:type IX secretion system protein PorQ [Sphingobacteriia bacterium]
MIRRYCFILIFVVTTVSLFGQAGKDTYQFLNLPTSARIAAFGGSNVSLRDSDINFSFQNPALLTAKTHNMLSLNYASYLAGINFGSAIYGRNFGKKNYMAFGIHYIDYGTFLETDVTDQVLGEFTAKDFAINIMYARQLPKGFTVGATLKPIYSVYERYTSFGVALDLGANYTNDSIMFSAGLAIRNLGFQFTGYYSIDGQQHRESLPLDIQLGISQKLWHAPLRFSMTIHNIQQWDLGFRKEEAGEEVVSTNSKAADIIDMMFRHTIFTIEILPTKNFYIVASYNHRRRMEMNVPDFKTAAGFSFGAGIKIYKFHVGFSLTPYQVGNLSYHFTLSTGLSEFGVK